MNTNVKTYIDGLLVKPLGESIRQTIKDILADELGQICNTTINNAERNSKKKTTIRNRINYNKTYVTVP
jgi:hypothetical protein